MQDLKGSCLIHRLGQQRDDGYLHVVGRQGAAVGANVVPSHHQEEEMTVIDRTGDPGIDTSRTPDQERNCLAQGGKQGHIISGSKAQDHHEPRRGLDGHD